MKKSLMITPIQTEVFHRGENLLEFIMTNIPQELWQEGTVLAITSKILSLSENSLIPTENTNKKDLIREQADHYLGEIGLGVSLTIKHGLLLAAAGIDESNSEGGEYILPPKDPFTSAENLYLELKQKLGLQNLGILITDSRTSPLRHGVTGVSLSFAGFHPVRSLVGEEDLFGRQLSMTKTNLADSLATAAVLMMGEAAECCPLAVIKNAPVSFTDSSRRSDLLIDPKDDIYLPLYQHLIK